MVKIARVNNTDDVVEFHMLPVSPEIFNIYASQTVNPMSAWYRVL